MEYGDQIRYVVADGLGSMRGPNGAKFDGPKIHAGQIGEYLASTQAAMKEAGHPMADEMAGWHLTCTEVDGETFYVPVHDTMFGAVD